MRRTRWPLTTLLIMVCLTGAAWGQPSGKRIIGYYTSWSIYARDYHVPDIPADRITHINYAFANIDNATGRIILGDEYADTQRFYPGNSWHPDSLRGCFRQLQILRASHPHLKYLISVGGWTWSAYFSNIALTPQSRNIFARSCMEFIDRYEFNGIDIDWEYPVSGGLPTNIYRPEDRRNYTLLLAELRRQLDSLETANSQEYLLTIAAPANPAIIANIEVDSIPQYLDWINVMTYDFHGPWGGAPDPVTNFNSPLHIAPDDPLPEPYHSSFNLEAAVRNYLALGVPQTKLHPGCAFYGRAFAEVPNVNNGLFASYNGPSWQGTWEPGVFDHWDLLQNYINRNGYTSFWHDSAKAPWLYNPTTRVMISYDDTVSIDEKGRFIVLQGLAGAMFWEFSADKDSVLLQSLILALEYLPIEVVLTPINPPIRVPTGGGSFEYTVNIRNTSGVPQEFGCWAVAELPNGSLFGPIIQRRLTLISQGSATRTLNQNVPANAPAGNYRYIARVGQYPAIWTEDSFEFTKQAGETGAGLVDCWDVYGWDTFASNAEPQEIQTHNLLSVNPNPFNASADLSFRLQAASQVKLVVYDITGREAAVLVDGYIEAGMHRAVWDACSLSSGVYFLRLSAGGAVNVKKAVLLK